MDPALASLYQPMDVAKSEIRVLIIPADDSKCFEMTTISLDKKPLFAALSYVWGDPNDRASINIQGRSVSVTKSLKAALSCMRLRVSQMPPSPEGHGGFFLWADAICINQNDLAERASQVKLMFRIYRSARIVYSWLGSKDHSLSFRALRFLVLIVRHNKPEGVPEQNATFESEWLRPYLKLCEEVGEATTPFHNPVWDGILDLLRDPYWDRVWIFQEVALARQLKLLTLGNKSMPWMDLVTVSLALYRLRDRIASKDSRKPSFFHDGVWCAISTRDIRWNKVHQLCRAQISLTERTGSPGGDRAVRWEISALAASLKATDPRDYIYGLLGMTGIPITPDYRPERSVSDLYTDYVHAWLEASRAKLHVPGFEVCALGFLYVAGIGHFGSSAEFPSWAPNYPNNNLRKSPINTIPVGIPQQAIFPEDSSKIPSISRATKSLFVWGIEIESVLSVFQVSNISTDKAFLTFVVDFMSRHPRYVSLGGIPPLQAILRFLMKNESGPVTRSMVLDGFSLLCVLDELDTEGNYNFLPSNDFERGFAELLFPATNFEELSFEDSLFSALLTQCGEVVLRISRDLGWAEDTWGLMETTTGYLGGVPSGSATGDLLCVLKGCNAPVLLRKRADDYFLFVGIARVLGLMNGEAAGLISTGRSAIRRFELR